VIQKNPEPWGGENYSKEKGAKKPLRRVDKG